MPAGEAWSPQSATTKHFPACKVFLGKPLPFPPHEAAAPKARELTRSRPRKHGTFRPTLLSLVSSNPDNTVSALTAAVFSLYDSGDEPADVPSLVSRLTALKGVGPATASLVLSAFDPARVPFFGDELFRWAMWDAPVSGRAAPGASATGWKRKIGYSAKEYAALVDVVERVTARLGVPASEVERVAFVLGREGASVDEGVEVEDEAKAAGGGGKRKISNGGDAARDEDSELEKKKRRA